jgi:hypothetical protein
MMAAISNGKTSNGLRGARVNPVTPVIPAQAGGYILAFIERHNEKPKPYIWTKSADEILASVKRFCQKTEQTLCGEL